MVEDDRAVRLLFTEVLQASGYRVIACENGTVGLAAARASIDTIDAIVTDSSMPGIKGPQLIAQIRALRPGLPAIIISGSMEPGEVVAGAQPATVFLHKPASPGALTRELRRLLSGRM